MKKNPIFTTFDLVRLILVAMALTHIVGLPDHADLNSKTPIRETAPRLN